MYSNYLNANYSRSIVYFKNNLIVETDSSNFIRFDNNLIPIDTLSFNKLGILDSTHHYQNGYQLDIDSQYLYIDLNGFYKKDSLKVYTDTLYRTKDFTSIESFCTEFLTI